MGQARFPVTVLVDTNEIQHGRQYTFGGLQADKTRHKEGGPLAVQTVPHNLVWGDYSLEGFADRVVVERKTLADLFATLTEGRKRFVCELQALSHYRNAFVVVEANEDDIFRRPPSAANPKSIHRSVLAFRCRYPVQWVFASSREFAEKVTFRLLEKAWEETFPEKDRKKIKY